MYQTDWVAKFGSISNCETSSKNSSCMRKAIATILGLQIAALSIIPSELFAQTSSGMSYFQDDIPEEVLRADIYTDARSPIDGKRLTATEYVELMEKLRSLDSIPPENFVSPKVREVIELLRLRKLLRQFIPFIP